MHWDTSAPLLLYFPHIQWEQQIQTKTNGLIGDNIENEKELDEKVIKINNHQTYLADKVEKLPKPPDFSNINNHYNNEAIISQELLKNVLFKDQVKKNLYKVM